MSGGARPPPDATPAPARTIIADSALILKPECVDLSLAFSFGKILGVRRGVLRGGSGGLARSLPSDDPLIGAVRRVDGGIKRRLLGRANARRRDK